MAQTEPIDDEGDEAPPLTLLEALVLVVTGLGAIAGVVWGAIEFGVLGAIVGFPVGAAIGFAASYVIVLPLVIFCVEGPCGLWAYIWGLSPRARDTPPPQPPETNS